MPIVVRPGRPEEAAQLSDLALRSKAFWGYDEKFLAFCLDELTLAPSEVAPRRTAVAELDGTVAGFVTIEGIPPIGELGMLFVAPDIMGRGIGTALFRHALETARNAGFDCLTIESDPHAEQFYIAMGAIRLGSVPSGALPGRELPLLEIEVMATPPRPARHGAR